MQSFAAEEPKIAPDVFVADSAEIIGGVEIGAGSSVWFGSVIRADNNRIRLGREVNVQDGSVIHEDPSHPVWIGDRVSIGHRAVVHGCTVGDDVLIGMGAILLSGCRIGSHCLIAAGALVTGKMDIPDGSLVMGAPARVVKPLTPELEEEIRFTAEEYAERGREYLNGRFCRYMPQEQ